MSASMNSSSKQFITTYAVNALKSRAAIYFEDWAAAKTAAFAVINSEAFEIADAADYDGPAFR